MRQEDEHQAGAALIQLRTSRCHSGDDHQCCQTCCQCIEKCYTGCGSRNVFVIRQIRTVNNSAVACNGQGEECLAQCIYPGHGVFQSNRINAEDIFVAFCGTGLHEDIYRQTNKQNEEQRHHNFVCFFDPFADTEHCDQHTDHQCAKLPSVIAEGTCHAAESTCIAINICVSQGGACECADSIFQDPAHNNGIANGHSQSTDHRDQPQSFPQFAFALAFQSHTEGIYGAGTGRAAEGHFTDHAGSADQYNKDEIRDDEGSAAIEGYPGREHPKVAHTNSRADTGKNKTKSGGKRITVFHNTFSFENKKCFEQYNIFFPEKTYKNEKITVFWRYMILFFLVEIKRNLL